MLRPDEQVLVGHVGLDPQSRKTLQTALGNRAVILDSESSNGLVATGSTGAAVPVPYYPTTGGTGGGSSVAKTITGSFSVGNVVHLSGSSYVLAQSDNVANADAVGIVSLTSPMTMTTHGYVSGMSGLVAGSIYFLSATVAGALSLVDPNVSGSAGQVSKPIFVADSTTSGYFINYRGDVLTSSPVAGFSTFSQLASVSGINAKTVANTTLYTPAAGKTCVVTCVVIRPTLATAITNGPTIGIGTNATPSNIFASTALTALTSTSVAFNFNAPGILTLSTNTAPALLGVNAAATGTAMTISADVWGYIL